jgi:AP-3 complex subunit delta-1
VKDITSSNVWEASVALNCLGNICTTDLARDLAADVVSLLNSSRPYIRKKACLVLYKIFFKFPDALRPAFPRLKEKLEDPDPGINQLYERI